jgi:hypothetical protein
MHASEDESLAGGEISGVSCHREIPTPKPQRNIHQSEQCRHFHEWADDADERLS